ncbi:C4-dicarboxylate TRAP transporter substrate-binding protein [Bordetella sp. 15P40C-2]|uniref:C4-dicarboxylate TRAP transporter substrate-binding protein n=1 Tax=Bordetella sp. 15P40C-2 TaxID=2572246 RepID=UPI0013238478|nr:C4-dicarboxylate TRAP transporter substrate-binding protein [Bordetella sp. 15P40C-2]MVW72365.1 C4-dicarboxylate ABC transporter substrate-binding protein [Bordetella sp. 15P40C-2]
MKIKRFANVILGTVIAGVACYASPTFSAQTLRYAHGNPPAAPSVKAAERYKELVEQYSNGTLKVRVFPNSLLANQEISAGLQDGLADVGLLLTSYHPSEYPKFSMVADLSMMATSSDKGWKVGLYAFVGALMDYVFFDCPQCHTEFAQHNQVYLGGFSSTPYGLACTKPVVTLGEIKGLSIRAVGASWARWTEFVGARPITMPGSEMLQALAQGVVGCVETNLVDLINWGLYDVTTDFTTDVPGGAFAQVAGMQVNANVWKRLTPQERTALMRGSAAQAAGTLALYIAQEEAAIARIKKDGRMKLHKPAEDLMARTREFVVQDRNTIVAYYEKNFGVKDGAAEVDKLVQKFDKWLNLMQNVETGQQAESLYWDHLYSKLDAASYGL